MWLSAGILIPHTPGDSCKFERVYRMVVAVYQSFVTYTMFVSLMTIARLLMCLI